MRRMRPIHQPRRTRRIYVLGAGLTLLGTAACGTRLPDSAFASQSPGAAGTTAALSANTASDVGVDRKSVV